jgi:hypothetical protein
VVAPPHVTPREVDPQEEIDAALRRLGCARVDARYDFGTGNVSLSGRLSSQGDRSKLLDDLSQIAGVTAVEASSLGILGRPYCEILGFLGRPELALSSDERPAPAPAAASAPVRPPPAVQRLVENDPLRLQLRSPDFPSHIYIDYFSSDGTVAHLLPAKGLRDNRFDAKAQVTIGDMDSRALRVVVKPPFGLDIVLALASSEPLFQELRPPQEDASGYLSALGFAIDRLRARNDAVRLEYSYHLIETAPAPAP